MTSYDKVLAARNINRPTATEYIDKMINNFVELHGDRNIGDDAAIITARPDAPAGINAVCPSLR